jgi:hypothetical protein
MLSPSNTPDFVGVLRRMKGERNNDQGVRAMAVATGYDSLGAEVRVEIGRGVVTQVEGLGHPLPGGLHRNYRVTIRPTHSPRMRFPVTGLTMSGEATLSVAFAALAAGIEVDYTVQVRRIAGVDQAAPLSALRATVESARASVRRLLVQLGAATSSEETSLLVARPESLVVGARPAVERRCA